MATNYAQSRVQITSDTKSRVSPVGSTYFDLISALLSFWLTSGLYLDGFSHHHQPGTIETFFTPWHGVLYSGLLVNALWLLAQRWRYMNKGHDWLHALPRGYQLSLLGVVIFMFSGVADLLWHEAFGFEVGLEALISPSHLALAMGGGLIISGPLRAAAHRFVQQQKLRWQESLPLVVSLMMVLSLLTFFTGDFAIITYPNLMVKGLSAPTGGITFFQDIHALASVLIPAALTIAVILFALKQWVLPRGSMTMIIVGNGLLMAWFHAQEVYLYPQVILAIVLSGLVTDVLYWRLMPSPERLVALRIFSFAVPMMMFGIYFITLINTAGIWWSVHMWTGSVFLASVAGLLLSYLAIPRDNKSNTA